jgi:hypothetical protein
VREAPDFRRSWRVVPAIDSLKPGRELTRAGVSVKQPDRRVLARGEPHPHLELLREIVIEIEQVGVQRR